MWHRVRDAREASCVVGHLSWGLSEGHSGRWSDEWEGNGAVSDVMVGLGFFDELSRAELFPPKRRDVEALFWRFICLACTLQVLDIWFSTKESIKSDLGNHIFIVMHHKITFYK